MITDLVNPNNYKSYYDNNNKVNDPFVISLKKDINKYTNTKHILNNLKLNPIKFDAVNGKEIKETKPSIFNKFKRLNDGEIGCFLSHLSVYYLASLHKNKDQYTMIFEDDIGTDLNASEFKNKVDNIVKYNKNLIYLGKCAEFCKKINKIEDDIYEGYKPYCMHAYLIKNSFASKVLNNIFSRNIISLPIDVIIFASTQKQDIIEYHPSIFYQDPKYASNLRSKLRQMANEFECRDILQLPRRSISIHFKKIIIAVLLMVLLLIFILRK